MTKSDGRDLMAWRLGGHGYWVMAHGCSGSDGLMDGSLGSGRGYGGMAASGAMMSRHGEAGASRPLATVSVDVSLVVWRLAGSLLAMVVAVQCMISRLISSVVISGFHASIDESDREDSLDGDGKDC